MFLSLDANDKRPIYQQIADGIKALIARGELREGMALPSVRQVSGDLGVNLNTIAVAYRQLQDEGLVTVRHGAGATISSRRGHQPEKKEELLKSLRTALTDWILAGFDDQAITAAVQQELALLQQKGNSR
jgi:GntR family transcriptional regulator